MLKIPENAEVVDTPTSIYWYDESGILYSVSKRAEPLSLEETKAILEEFRSFLRAEKVCMLIDVTNTTESSREVRDYAAAEFPKFVKAIAMISESALGKMLANLFFSLKSQPYPTRMFTNEEDAKAWLQQYL
jgi:hypothetical protein